MSCAHVVINSPVTGFSFQYSYRSIRSTRTRQMAYRISPSTKPHQKRHAHTHHRHNHPLIHQQAQRASWSIGTALNSEPLASSSSTQSPVPTTVNTSSSSSKSSSVSAPPTAAGSSSSSPKLNTSVDPVPPNVSLPSPTAIFSPHSSRHGQLTLQPYPAHHQHHHAHHPREQNQHHHHPLSSTRELSEIIPQIYISDLSFAESASSLTTHKITHILSVLPDAIYTPPPSLLPSQPERLQIKVEDSPFAELAVHLPQTTRWIVQAIEANPEARVLVHCAEGISRSVTVVAAFLMKWFGWSPHEAVGFVKSKRRVADPNFGFVEQLHEYGRNVLGQNCWNNTATGPAGSTGGGAMAVDSAPTGNVEGHGHSTKSTSLGSILESPQMVPSVIVPKQHVPFALPLAPLASLPPPSPPPPPPPPPSLDTSPRSPAPMLDTDFMAYSPTSTPTSADSSTLPSPSTSSYPALTSLSSLSSLPRIKQKSKASRSTLSLLLPAIAVGPVSPSRHASGGSPTT